MMIDYNKIAKAIDFYSSRGFTQVEVPWVIDYDVHEGTVPMPSYTEDFRHNEYRVDRNTIFNSRFNRYLVGSAEQGFIQLMKENKISAGKYLATTPCFRSDTEDELHQPYFMKVELIHILEDRYYTTEQKNGSVRRIAEYGKRFFDMHLDIQMPESKDAGYNLMIDIVDDVHKIELGSYGYRSINLNEQNYQWCYGTGLAEPRLSTVLAKYESEK